jgi:ribose transport system permease protein
MPAMICTLAMMQVLQGITYTITGAQPIYGLPESLRILGQGYIVGIPVPIIIMIIVFLVGGFILNKTYIGRYFYAVGSNPEAARLSGLPLKNIKLLAFIISGFFVGLGGIVLMSRMFSGQPSAGDGFEMDVLTACIVGGIAFSGGYGKIEGLIPGVLVMGIISNGLGVMGVSAYDQLMYKGIVLILVVGIDSIQQARAKKQKTRVDNAEILSKTEYDQIAEEKGKMA